jgi:hypothetical protein
MMIVIPNYLLILLNFLEIGKSRTNFVLASALSAKGAGTKLVRDEFWPD